MNRFSVLLVSTLILTGASETVFAGTVNAIINGRSHHVGASHDWNENNVGLGVEYQFDSTTRWKASAMANGFRDSNNEMSYMAGGSVHRRLVESPRLGGFYLDAGITAFLMTREDVNAGRPFPGVLPSIAIGNRYAGFNLAYMPEAGVRAMTNAQFEDPTLKGVLYLQLKFSLDRLLPSFD